MYLTSNTTAMLIKFYKVTRFYFKIPICFPIKYNLINGLSADFIKEVKKKSIFLIEFYNSCFLLRLLLFRILFIWKRNFFNILFFNCFERKTLLALCIFCVSAGETFYDCNKIDYFSKEEYSPDPNDSTMAIPCK